MGLITYNGPMATALVFEDGALTPIRVPRGQTVLVSDSLESRLLAQGDDWDAAEDGTPVYVPPVQTRRRAVVADELATAAGQVPAWNGDGWEPVTPAGFGSHKFEVAGDSWTIDAAVVGWGWPEKVRRMLGIEAADTVRLGVGGATAVGAADDPSYVGMTAKVLQYAHEHFSGDAPSVGDWIVPSGIAAVSIGFNDQYVYGGAGFTPELVVKSSMRALISRFRATRVYEDTDARITYNASWYGAGSTNLNSGPSFSYSLTDGATATFDVPDDYAGQPLTIGFTQNGAFPMNCDLNVKADGVTVADFDLRPIQAAGNFVYPGALRLPSGIPVGTTTLTMTWNLDSSAIASLDYVAVEGEPLVLLILKPEMSEAYDPTGSLNETIAISNAWCEDVAAEYPDSVRIVDLRQTPMQRADGYWVASGNPHPSYSGHAVIAAAVVNEIAAARRNTYQLAGA